MTRIFFSLAFLLSFLFCRSQDTTALILSPPRCHIGFVYLSEYSKLGGFSDSVGFQAHSLGFPMRFRIKNSRSSIETGLFWINKKGQYWIDYYHMYGWPYYYMKQVLVSFHYFRIPLNYRFDTRIFYFSGGLCIDNLLYVKDKTDGLDVRESFPSRKFKLGFNVKLGMEKDIHNFFSLFIEARYSSDFNREYFSPGISFGNGEPIQNMGFGLGLNVKVPGKK